MTLPVTLPVTFTGAPRVPFGLSRPPRHHHPLSNDPERSAGPTVASPHSPHSPYRSPQPTRRPETDTPQAPRLMPDAPTVEPPPTEAPTETP
ncbi:MAG: hypothetical protein KC462_05535, partial [Cyanobacteria bacterium HKST-UBA05]|nr:hypothetical protein [Cyanobacteria bacterium HKST-UBA05]